MVHRSSVNVLVTKHLYTKNTQNTWSYCFEERSSQSKIQQKLDFKLGYFYMHSMVLHKDRIIGNMSFLALFDSWAKAIDILFNDLDFLGSFPVFISTHAPLKTNSFSIVLAIWQQLLGRSEAHLKCHRMSHAKKNYGCRNDHFLFFSIIIFCFSLLHKLGILAHAR